MELSYMDQETRMYDAINNLQNSRTEIEQGLIHRESELVDLNLRIGLLEKEYLRKKGFYAEKLISDKEFEDVDREYHYTLKKIQLALALKRLDSVSGIEQKKQISSSINRMNQNLGMLKKNIAGLVMKSPVEGQLSGFSVEIGETKIPGQRLGQIDMQDGYKMRASIDERYVSKVAKGQAAELEVDQITHKLVVDKIFTDVSNGVFQVDFEFESNAPASIKKGQTLAMRLNLGGGQEAMVIPRGAFFYDSGGQYIYVLDQSGSFATKRNIRIGRQNIYKYEITEGLEVGEKVLISSYASFGGKDKLLFKK
jgi:HlyD family secretion protein